MTKKSKNKLTNGNLSFALATLITLLIFSLYITIITKTIFLVFIWTNLICSSEHKDR